MRGRIEELVYHVADRNRIWRSMEILTGVSGRSWQNAIRGQQRPTVAMFEAIGRVWPQYAFWLMTGRIDEKNGHVSPASERVTVDLAKRRSQERGKD